MYMVSAEASAGGIGGLTTRRYTVAQAIEQARAYLASGHLNVSIRDARWHVVDGEKLAAVCRGEKFLTDDLGVI
jgi:hypothetical protein